MSVFDAGFMQGIGLFETLRAYHGHVFRLERHLDRLLASAQALGWTRLPDVEEATDNVMQAARAAGGEDARLRLTVTTGSLHSAERSEVPELTYVAMAAPGGRYPADCYTKGVTVAVSECRQNPFDLTATHKTTSYFPRLVSLRTAHVQSAFEALWFTPEGKLACGAISNVFVVRDEQLLTPPLDAPIIPGITRATVMELAVEHDIPVKEEWLSAEDLIGADEVFLTNSMFEVMPVVRIDRKPVGNEKPGDITRQLAIEYGKLIDLESGNA